MKKLYFVFMMVLLLVVSCKAFRLTTSDTEVVIESAHMRYLSIICADDTNLLV